MQPSNSPSQNQPPHCRTARRQISFWSPPQRRSSLWDHDRKRACGKSAVHKPPKSCPKGIA